MTSMEERSYNIAKPLLLGLNVLAYISYAFIALFCKLATLNYIDKQMSIPDYLTTIWGFYGVIYLVFCTLMLIFGSKVCLVVLTKKSLSSAAVHTKEHNAFKAMARRTIVLTTLLVVVFFVRAIYNLLFSWGLMNSIFSLSYYWLTAESLVN